MSQFNFIDAIEHLKKGRKIRQSWWVDKNAYIHLNDQGLFINEFDRLTDIELDTLYDKSWELVIEL